MPINKLLPQNFSDGTKWGTAGLAGAATPVVTSGITDPLGGTTAYQIAYGACTTTGQQVSIGTVADMNVIPFLNGASGSIVDQQTFAVWMRCAAGPADTNIFIYSGTNWMARKRVTVTPTWQRFTVNTFDSSTVRYPGIGTSLVATAYGMASTSAITVEVWRPEFYTTPTSLDSGLIHFWRLNGNLLDSVGTEHGVALPSGAVFPSTSTLYETVDGGGLQPWVSGAASTAITFPTPTTGRLQHFTVSVWVRVPQSLSTYSNILSCFNGTNLAGWILSIDNLGTPTWLTGNAQGGGSWHPTRDVRDGQWHHLVWTVTTPDTGDFYSGSNPPRKSAAVTLFIDGLAYGGGSFGDQTPSYSYVPTYPTPSGLLHLGEGWVSNGVIANVGMWNRPLSVQEVTQLYNFGVASHYPLSGGIPVNTAPSVSNVTPSTSTNLGPATPLQFDVTDPEGFGRVRVMVEFGSGSNKQYDVVYDGTKFADKYLTSSTKTAISGGFRFVVRPSTGWALGTVSVLVDAVDAGGLENA